MSFAVTAAVVVASAASLYTAHEQRKAQSKAADQARADQLKDQANARKAEVFAETEGEGLGGLGKISFELDDELDDEELSSNISI